MATGFFSALTDGMVPLPQGCERLFSVLPRSLLRQLEVYAHPGTVPQKAFAPVLSFWNSRRIALVRQTSYRGAYLPCPGQGWEQTVLSAPAHLGPFSFLADLKADYFVVRQGREPETFLWKEKFSGDPDPNVAYREVEAWQEAQEGRGAVDAEEIPWDRYDLVVCLDIPVPTRLTAKTKKTVWTYFSVEAGGPLHKRSLRQPVAGYHLYLNHAFRRYRIRPGNRSHVLEFPFTFQSAAAWKSLAWAVGNRGMDRRGTLVDRASWESSPEKKPSSLSLLQGNAAEMVRRMTSSQFAVRTDARLRWGNWPLEAIQAGCLFLGRADTLALPGILLPGLTVSDLPSAARRIGELAENPARLRRLSILQAELAEHLAFRRPLLDLTRSVRSILAP